MKLLKKPANYYMITEQRGLMLGPSTETFRYYMLINLGLLVFNFGVIWISIVVSRPVTTTQYVAWVFIALVSVVAAVAFCILLFSNTRPLNPQGHLK